MLVKKLCQSYFGLTPTDIENMTLDQIYLLAASDEDLRAEQVGGTQKMSWDEAVARGIVANEQESLVQKVRRELAEQRAKEERQKRREKRAKKAERRQAAKQQERQADGI